MSPVTPRVTHSPAQAAQAIEQAIQQKIADTLKKLLEQKHLYQSLDVAIDDVAAPIAKAAMREGNFEERLEVHGIKFFGGRWFFENPTLPHVPSSPVTDRDCMVPVRDIKTFCKQCGRIEPFNLLVAVDFLSLAGGLDRVYRFGVERTQIFVLSFLCQGCKRVPEVFVVRRVGGKITNCGRSPIEHVEVAKYVPEAAKQYVSGAIVAHQSGQTLAGLFLLRTSIEQWIRSLGADHDKADQAIDWYMSTLPLDFNARFPSLRDVYSRLSDAMHKADASAVLFDQAKADIESHFDARRVFKLEDPKYEPSEH